MAEAAKSARSAFTSIGTSARQGGAEAEEGMLDVRHQLGALDNALRGNHAAAMTDFIRLFQNSAFVMAAMPFAAPIAGFLLLSGTVVEAINKIKQLREAHEKLADDMTDFSTVANNTWDGLDSKIRQAEERADELRNDHLDALKLKLVDIDHASMGELIKSLEAVAKASDSVFKDLQGHWYTFGIGSDGASHALKQFQIQYENLMAQGKDKEASDLLHGTLESAKQVLAFQKDAKANSGTFFTGPSANADIMEGMYAQYQLKKDGVGYTQKEIEAQQQLVDALNAQVTSEQKIAELNKLDKNNATTQVGNEAGARRAAAAKEAAASQLRMAESVLAGDKATADAQLTIQHASIQARLQNDISFANRERDAQLAANKMQMDALDKAGKDYTNQLAALQDKALEITQEHDTKVAELKARASVQEAQQSLQALQGSEREKIDATNEGSSARLAAINEAIRQEEALRLQNTDFYRELMHEQGQAARDAAQQERDAAMSSIEARMRADSAKNKSGMQSQEQDPSWMNKSIQQRAQLEIDAAQRQYQIKQAAASEQIGLLMQTGNTNSAELQKQFNAELAARQEYEDTVTQITRKAAADQLRENQQLWDTTTNGYAQSFLKVAEGKESLTRTMVSLESQALSHFISAVIMRMTMNKSEQLSEAAKAAAGAYGSMSGIPFIGPALGAVAASAVFAGAMAFADGTDRVPGVGSGDTVPAMLTPGEGVVPGGVMDGLRNMARNGHMGGSHTHVHMQYRPTFHVQTIDGDGVQDMLDKHTDAFQKHFEHTVRRMNK